MIFPPGRFSLFFSTAFSNQRCGKLFQICFSSYVTIKKTLKAVNCCLRSYIFNMTYMKLCCFEQWDRRKDLKRMNVYTMEKENRKAERFLKDPTRRVLVIDLTVTENVLQVCSLCRTWIKMTPECTKLQLFLPCWWHYSEEANLHDEHWDMEAEKSLCGFAMLRFKSQHVLICHFLLFDRSTAVLLRNLVWYPGCRERPSPFQSLSCCSSSLSFSKETRGCNALPGEDSGLSTLQHIKVLKVFLRDCVLGMDCKTADKEHERDKRRAWNASYMIPIYQVIFRMVFFN